MICTFVAATVPVESAGDVNPLMEAAQAIGDERPVEEDKTVAVSLANFDPENPPIPDNGNASFERFLGSFGSPARWAGRG